MYCKWRAVRGRSRLGWMDDVKVAFGGREMTVEAARHCPKDRKEWKALVHVLMIEFNAAIFCMAICSFGYIHQYIKYKYM